MTKIERRALLIGGTSLGVGSALGGCDSGPAPTAEPSTDRRATENARGERPRSSAPTTGTPAASSSRSSARKGAAVLERFALGAPPWRTFDPFLFCVHHRDHYPQGNARLGPTASLEGRNIGSDFGGKDGWSMYHGDVVPGFPRHPHRGFETVTITRRGYVDHSDSLGATARYGEGDVQWMTAGRGIVHAEMFPLLDSERDNPTELFQIWLNLPRRNKFVAPHFSMLWGKTIPRVASVDARGRKTQVAVIAGELSGKRAPRPPPSSWASEKGAAVGIWSLRMDAEARFELPGAAPNLHRTLYFFSGDSLSIDDENVASGSAVRLISDRTVTLKNAGKPAEALLLEGRPIGEPVVQHGPFVMNERAEIRQAVVDYQKTQFGGWPWPKNDPVHAATSGRFAIHADGKRERGA